MCSLKVGALSNLPICFSAPIIVPGILGYQRLVSCAGESGWVCNEWVHDGQDKSMDGCMHAWVHGWIHGWVTMWQ